MGDQKRINAARGVGGNPRNKNRPSLVPQDQVDKLGLQRSNRRMQMTVNQIQAQLSKITKGQSVEEIHQKRLNQDTPESQVFDVLMSGAPSKRLLKMLGQKALATYMADFERADGKPLTSSDRRAMLIELLEDDLPKFLTSALRTMAPEAVSWLWQKIKNSDLFNSMKNRLGFNDADLNDDAPFTNVTLGNRFSLDKSLRRNIQWSEIDPNYLVQTQAFDGVSTQAICSALFPEMTATRFPSDVAMKTGLVHRTQSYTLTSNVAGNAGFCLFPNRLTQGNWIMQFNNDAGFNPDSGASTNTATFLVGPVAGLNSIVQYQTTATSIVLDPITSSLQNGGRVITIMNNYGPFASINSLPAGITNGRDNEYITYSSLAASSGHRMSYTNTSDPESTFSNYGATIEDDYMVVILQGCNPSVPVIQLEVSYTLEYTIQNNILVELSTPPPGAATRRCLAQALARRPELRIIGRQESRQLYEALTSCVPRYADVLAVLTTFKFNHPGNILMSGASMSS